MHEIKLVLSKYKLFEYEKDLAKQKKKDLLLEKKLENYTDGNTSC